METETGDGHRSQSVTRVFVLPAWMSSVRVTGANIDNPLFFKHAVTNFHDRCPGLIPTIIHSPAPGFGAEGEQQRWSPLRECLGEFVALFPQNLEARWLPGQVREGDGDWEGALRHYHAVAQRKFPPLLASPGV